MKGDMDNKAAEQLESLRAAMTDLTIEVRSFCAAQREICRASTKEREEMRDTLYDSETGLAKRLQTAEDVTARLNTTCDRMLGGLWAVGLLAAALLLADGWSMLQRHHATTYPVPTANETGTVKPPPT